MTENTVHDAKALRDALRLDNDELDEVRVSLESWAASIDSVRQDLGIALTSLITTAVHDKEPKRSLSDIVEALKQGRSASSLVR